jgi:hypothetical protein
VVGKRTKRSKSKPSGYCEAFDLFWSAYPRREGKRNAYAAWKAAGSRIKKSKGFTSCEAAAYLLEQATAYRDSPRGHWPMSKIPHPSTWLNDDRFYDDPSTWDAEYNAQPTPVIREFGRNHAVLESVLADFSEVSEDE